MHAIRSENQPQTPLLARETQIVLQVGERRFITTRDTLTDKSAFFESLLSGRWDNKQADGSYFIDADPDLFNHILSYLRRGILPIFYTKTSGHDYGLYNALLHEAKYFQTPRLEKWLQDKEYLKAVKVEATISVEAGEFSSYVGAGGDLELYPEWQTKKVYVCPRGIFVHRGIPSACGRQCRNAQGDEPQYDEEKVLQMAVVRKEVVFDPKMCVEEPESSSPE